jgi:hypothetical protein
MSVAFGGHTEVGGYGIHDPIDPADLRIYVSDFVTVRQAVDPCFCSLDTDHASELLLKLCEEDEDFNPNRMMALWCHTHPGDSVTPSGVDWETFAGHAGSDWAGMIILGRDGRLGAHIRQRGALGGSVKEVHVSVDWEHMDECATPIDPEAWKDEYVENVWPSAKDSHPDFRRARPAGMVDMYDRATGGRSGFGARDRRMIELTPDGVLDDPRQNQLHFFSDAWRTDDEEELREIREGWAGERGHDDPEGPGVAWWDEEEEEEHGEGEEDGRLDDRSPAAPAKGTA